MKKCHANGMDFKMKKYSDADIEAFVADIESERVKNTSFDLTAIQDSKLSDLSRAVFEEEYLPSAFAPDILAQNGRSYEERLASCKMIVSPENTTPTVLGILTLGKDPQRFIPCSYVQFIGFAGTTIGDPVIDGTKITGRINRVIDEVRMHISAFNRTAYEVEGAPKHRVFSDYSISSAYDRRVRPYAA